MSAVLLGVGAWRAPRGPEPILGGVILHLAATNAVAVTMFCWQAAPETVAGSGSGQTVGNVYSGPAYAISAEGLQTNVAALIECSTDLVHWSGFPQPGFQLTLLKTNAQSVIVPPDGPMMFFRARVVPWPIGP